MADVNQHTGKVISAVWTLHERHDRWPTIPEIADHLQLDEQHVKAAVRALVGERIMRQCTRQSRRVVMPWRET